MNVGGASADLKRAIGNGTLLLNGTMMVTQLSPSMFRPIVLYTCGNGNTPLAMPISKDPSITTTSNVFRLEKLDGCCATCRVLAPNTDESSVFPYEATNSFFTINLGCCCVLRCLDDTFVECI